VAETIATIHADGRARHNDVSELQVRRDQDGTTAWLLTKKGPIILGDRAMLRELVRVLRRSGYSGEQLQVEETER
jgi:hypothetical protein